MASPGFGLSGNEMSGLLALLGAGAGGFGTSTSGTSSTSSSQNGMTTFTQNLQSLLSSLSQISGSSNQQGQQTGTTTSGYANQGDQNLSNQLAIQFAGLTKAPDLTGYEAQQAQQINSNSKLAGDAQQEALASRGLSTSPVAGSVAATQEGSRIGQISNLQASIPLLSNQLALSNLGAANSFLANAPKTSTTSGTSSQQGTTQQSQSTNQSGTQSGSGSTAINNTSQSNTASNQKAGGGAGGIFGGLGSILASLFG